MKRNRLKSLSLLLAMAMTGGSLCAQAPNGYYDGATGKTGTELRQALHDIIDEHTTISYAQIWNAFWSTDNKGNNEVWDMYSDGANYTYYYTNSNHQCGSFNSEGDCYNREHSWPKSWFSGGENGVPGRDLHHIFPTDGYVNAQRSNYPFGEVQNASWTSQNGSKLGSCTSSLGYTGTVFEPIDEYKGDFARAYFYMSTRYYGEDSDWGTSGMTNKADLKPWAITMLLNWSDNDPVSQKEIDRNNAVYGIQGNRNPFIDHPEYAHIIWDPNWTGVTYNIACATVQHGSITAPSTAVEGTTVTLSATPAQGYMLDQWSVYKTGYPSTTVTVSSNGTFTMPSFNVTVSATFVQNNTYYAIKQGTVSHGSISISTNSALSGTTINLTAAPASGYSLYAWYVYKTDDINTHVAVSGSGNTGSFVMPAYPVTVLASFAQGTGGNGDYVKVTSTPNDWSGEYLLVYEPNNNTGYVWTGEDAANCYVSKSVSNNTIAYDNSLITLTIESMSGGYSIKVNGGTNNGKYISGTSNNNTIYFGTSASANTLSYESNSVKIVSNTSVMRYNKNTNENRFRYYKSSSYTNQQAIQLYKKTSGTVTAPTHTIQFNPNGGSGTSYTQTVDEFDPTQLTLNTFTRSGFAFGSWNTAANGSGTTYFDGATVSLLNDLTLYAQWDPTYSITCSQPANGSISASASEAVEGALVVLTATPNTNYDLDYWMVTTTNDEPVEVDGNSFVMPASPVTVSAVFVNVGTTYTQKYYLVTSQDQLVEGRKYLIVNTTNNKAMSKTGTYDRNAVAVSISNNTIASWTDACEITLGTSGDYWTLRDDNANGYLCATSGNNTNQLTTQSTLDDYGKWTITVANDGSTLIMSNGNTNAKYIKYSNNSKIFNCYNLNSGSPVVLFVRSEEYEHDQNRTLACLNTFDKHTIHSGATLTANAVLGMTMCNNASQIVIEEGAQLIHNAEGLKATLKKTVSGYSGNGGWYTIAAPFDSYTPAGSMVANDYDLYAYNEAGPLEWQNHKQGNGFALVAGQGYLYAHAPIATLRMNGTLKSGSYSQNVNLGYSNSSATLKGYNLLGNPVAHEISFTKTSDVADGYYYLTNGSAWTYTTDNTVPVGRGFLVKANAANQTVTLNPQSKRGADQEKGQYLCVSVGDAKAYVKLDEGVSMPLLDFKGQHSGLYFVSEHQPYVMLVREDAQALDLCYEAQSNGTQTLTVNTKDLELSYLHLIDNKTGADVDMLSAGDRGSSPAMTTEGVSYTFTAKTTDYATRFRLVFGPSTPSTGSGTEGSGVFAYFADGEIRFVEACHGATLQIVDMTGRVIFSGDAINRVSTKGMAPGVYVLRLVTADDVRVQKIVVE